MEHIPAIREVLYLGANVRIEWTDCHQKKIFTDALVENIDKKALYLAPGDKTILKFLARKATIPVICKYPDEPRDLVFFAEIIKLKDNPPVIAVKRPVDCILGRRFLRYEVSLPFSYFLDGQEYTGCQTVDLSFGGLSGIVKPNYLLTPGTEIVCQIALPDYPASEFIVGRLIRLKDYDEHYNISICFENLTIDTEEKIAKYFFSIEKNAIRRANG